MKVLWADPAEDDLKALVLYIAKDDIDAALRMEDRILAAAGRLDRLPLRGRLGAIPGTRELVIGGSPYIAVYEVKDDAVWIVRVRHGAQDWPEDAKP